jgi:2-polyprenyl-6-methoxyphenol hydroxylase-like FAD-dependent oxidoreductase
MSKPFDVVVVGARCAGSPTAMLLARRGYRVLLVDRASFPSDTISTHVIQPLGVAALGRWGLLERLVATGCPPIHAYAFDFGPFTLTGSPGLADAPVAYSPRRTVLDKLLVDAAAEAGADVRERFTVDDILLEDGRVVGIRGRTASGDTVTERAAVVVGADGLHSIVARSVGPAQYDERPPLSCGYYTYWSGLPVEGRFENYVRPRRAFAAAPTHDGLTLLVVVWPRDEFEANKTNVERSYLRAIDLAPEFAERLRRARREARFAGATVPNFFRKPYGPGWALVGDAGYNKDFISAQGITDAFREAERCVAALDEALGGGRPYEDAMRDYQRERDERSRAMYELTCQLAALAPLRPHVERLLAAIAMHGDQRAMDAFAQMNAGTISPAEFLSSEAVRALGSSGPGAGPAGRR